MTVPVRQPSFREAALHVLTRAKHPLTVAEIVEAATRARLLSSAGKTPAQTMSKVLYQDIKRGAGSRFRKIADHREGALRAERASVRWTVADA